MLLIDWPARITEVGLVWYRLYLLALLWAVATVPLATILMALMLWYGFDRLNLHRIFLNVVAENVGAVRSYEKAGYQKEGVMRDEMYRNSRFYDMVKMAVLRDDYYAKWHGSYNRKFSFRL